jgi:NADP-dependent 3-hydroxy acid dehydrogenase YdfG
MPQLNGKVAIVTGSSSGIGEATARILAMNGYDLVLGARRTERLEKLKSEIQKQSPSAQVFTHELDVTDEPSVVDFVSSVKKNFSRIDALINNAGLALGLETIESGKTDDWSRVLETNVLGLLRVTRETLKHLIPAQHPAHIVNLGSVASYLVYEGGGIYTASKHAVKAITGTLRLELLGKPIRITSIDPGMVQTEFSDVRFRGDAAQAKKVYEGMKPLVAQDIAECIWFALSRPAHVNIDQIIVAPRDQAFLKVNRS